MIPHVKYPEFNAAAEQLFLEPKVTNVASQSVITNVARPNKRRILVCDTKYRANPSPVPPPHEPIVFALPERMTDVKGIVVAEVEIPCVWSNIADHKGNNTFCLVLPNHSVVPVTVPSDYYAPTDISAIVTSCNTTLASTVPLVTTSYDTAKRRFVFTSTATYAVTIEFAKGVPALHRTLGYLLGFRYPQYTLAAHATVVAEQPPNLLGTKNLYLSLDEGSLGNQNGFVFPQHAGYTATKLIAKIPMCPVLAKHGSLFTASSANGTMVSEQRNYSGGRIHLQQFRVLLVDDDGDAVDLQGADFSFALAIEHE